MVTKRTEFCTVRGPEDEDEKGSPSVSGLEGSVDSDLVLHGRGLWMPRLLLLFSTRCPGDARIGGGEEWWG